LSDAPAAGGAADAKDMPEVTKLRVCIVLLAGLVGMVAGMLAPPAHHYAPGSSGPPALSINAPDQ
jgi:hypothetical protein